MTKGHCGEHFRVCGDAAGGGGGGGLRGGREEEPGQGQGRHHHQGRVRPERKVAIAIVHLIFCRYLSQILQLSFKYCQFRHKVQRLKI